MKLNAFNLGMPQSRLPQKLPFIINLAMSRFSETEKRKLLMRVKLVVLIMTTCLLQVAAAGFAQKLTYKQKGATLEQIFKEITKQTGYEVFYADKSINAARTINVDFKNADLNEVLDKCLLKQPLSYAIEDNSIVIRIKQKTFFDKVMDFIAAVEVKGRVLDEKGLPLPGATVKTKDGSKTTQTNGNGEFQLASVDENAVLVINYLGYKTREITVNELKANPSIKMEVKAGELDEVSVTVSTGYQTLPKERATGSFTHISNEKLNEQVGKSIIARLDGITNGVSFDKAPNRPAYSIRGISSINANQAPLVILDNFPYEGDLNNINPNDVESVDVLKDAQAASIWGARAGNGVIVITTKKGKLNQPLTIGFNSNVVLTAKPDLYDYKLMSTSDFIDVEKALFSKDIYKTAEANRNKIALSPVVEILYDKVLTNDQKLARIDALRGIDSRDQASKLLYNNSVNQQYALNFQGGSAKSTYNISGGYDHGLDVLSGTSERMNLRAANTFKPIDKLQITTGLYYTNSSSKSGKPGYAPDAIGYKSYPYTLLQDDNGNSLPMDILRRAYTDVAGAGKLLDWKYYPLEDYKSINSTANLQSIVASAGLNYEIIKGLSVDAKYQYENQQNKGRTLQDVNSFFARDLINRGSKINTNTGVVEYAIPYGGYLRNSNVGVVSQNVRGQVNFNQTYGDHRIDAIAGSELRSTKTKSDGNELYGYDDDLLSSGKVDYKTRYTDFVLGSLVPLPDFPSSGERLYNFVSYYGNAAYTYKKKYTLSGSLRKDQSNLFGVKTNDKGVPLWSAGAGWNISDEPFYKVSFLPYLKLRASYGVNGNLSPGTAAVTTFLSMGSAFYTGLPQSTIENYANPELRWEQVKIFNIGVDFELINNILSGSVEYYSKNGVDLFGPADMDYTTTGQGTITKNVADMKGKGVDIALSSRILDRDFKWVQNFNFNYNTNKVTNYYMRTLGGNAYVTNGTSISPMVGQPLYSLVSHKWAGLDPLTGDPQGYLNGQVSKNYTELLGVNNPIENMVFSGSATPTVFGNFTNTVSWKALSLSVNVTYKMGHYFRRASINYTDLLDATSAKVGHSDYALRWQKQGDEQNTNVPSMIYAANANRTSFYNSSEVLVTKADHIRLQFINLAYSLRKSQIAKLPFQKLQLYANASNLGLLWKANKYDVDPEYNNSLNPKASFAFGLRADF
ncbi:SusC/RagA family TonB-linked outer membrane protein [Pedobacter hiemivivus]|uniref:SusC/RagA family TonB-linked outer membrane protein n=2 Tax=Pedobacter hiemivivus TaxID=2530454 RepID=A0A4R0N898_9SPHI|nr:SusC/RagA family TonB-linked outer membrane protein [Pedobacter hiemivivus]